MEREKNERDHARGKAAQKLTRFRQLRGRCDGIGIEFRIEFKIGITAVENTRRTLNESPRLDFDTGTYAMAIVSVCVCGIKALWKFRIEEQSRTNEEGSRERASIEPAAFLLRVVLFLIEITVPLSTVVRPSKGVGLSPHQ